MARTTLSLNNKRIVVEANAYTLIVYEDRFKGRRFLKDIDELVTSPSLSLGIGARMLWAIAKTANKELADYCEFTHALEISEIATIVEEITDIILESLTAVANPRKSNDGRQHSNSTTSAPELLAIAHRCGISISDLKDISLGFLMDICDIQSRLMKGEDIHADEEHYYQLKDVLPFMIEGFEDGTIPEAKYKAFMAEYEELKNIYEC
jgi:hypothetical protein